MDMCLYVFVQARIPPTDTLNKEQDDKLHILDLRVYPMLKQTHIIQLFLSAILGAPHSTKRPQLKQNRMVLKRAWEYQASSSAELNNNVQ